MVDAGKLTLILTSLGSVWEGRDPEFLTGKEITALAAERTTKTHYSDRYACAYLVREGVPTSGFSTARPSRSGPRWPASSAAGTSASRI